MGTRSQNPNMWWPILFFTNKHTCRTKKSPWSIAGGAVALFPFHQVAGGFGAYIGYTKAEAKACVADCFAQFEAAPIASCDFISVQLFGRQNAVSQQLWSFKEDPEADLSRFPEAFMEVQDRALCPMSERATEAEHKKIKGAQKRTFKVNKPATTNARKRQPQIEEMLDDQEQYEWVIANWKRRTIFPDLLKHLATPAEICRMGYAARLSRVYGYSAKDHFQDLSKERHHSEVARVLREKVQVAPEIAVSSNMALTIDFVKTFGLTGHTFGVPGHLFDLAVGGPMAAAPAPISTADLVLIFSGPEEVPDLAGMKFFTTVDPRPESKAVVKMAHVARCRTNLIVCPLQVVRINGAGVVECSPSSETVKLDISHWCSRDNFELVVRRLCSFTSDSNGIHVDIVGLPQRSMLALQPPSDVFAIDDDEMIDAMLVGVGAAAAADAVAIPEDHGAAIVARSLGVALSPTRQNILATLVQQRAFAENGADMPVARLPVYDEDVLCDIVTLAELGVVQMRLETWCRRCT